MRKVAVFVLVAVSSGSSAFAGIVRFDPSEQDVVIGGDDLTAMFDVYNFTRDKLFILVMFSTWYTA